VRAWLAPSLVVLALGAVAVSCTSDPTRGYSFKPAYNTQVRTVSVGMFENPTFYHGIEADLTDAIVKEIQQRTPWVVVSEGADTRLTGTIADVTMRPLTTSRRTGLVEDVALTMTVSFDWQDARSGKPIVRRRNFAATESFVPARPSGERLELGEHAVVQELARAIVSELRSSW
jgi:hypothetical protein